MTSPANTSYDASSLKKLLQPGVLGIYNDVELTTILGHHQTSKRTVNVLTHLVTVERTELGPSSDRPLKIKFSKLSGWCFGITRHSVPPAALHSKLENAIQKKEWAEEKGILMFGSVLYQGYWFAPPTGGRLDAGL